MKTSKAGPRTIPLIEDVRKAVKVLNDDEKSGIYIELRDYNTTVVRQFIAYIMSLPENTEVDPFVARVWNDIPVKWLSGEIPEVHKDKDWLPCRCFGKPNMRDSGCKECRIEYPDECLRCLSNLPKKNAVNIWVRGYYELSEYYKDKLATNDRPKDKWGFPIGSFSDFVMEYITQSKGATLDTIMFEACNAGFATMRSVELSVPKILTRAAENTPDLACMGCLIQGDDVSLKTKWWYMTDKYALRTQRGFHYYDLRLEQTPVAGSRVFSECPKTRLDAYRKRVTQYQRHRGLLPLWFPTEKGDE